LVYEWHNVFNLGLDQYSHSNFENQYLEFLKIVQNSTVNINLYSFQVFENDDFYTSYDTFLGYHAIFWAGVKHSICAIFRFECHEDLYMGDSVLNLL